jgi:hypothetical protein
VIGLYAAALDLAVRRLILRQTVTDYRSLSVAERYTQPFGLYAYGILREFDLPDVARSLESRPVLLINPTTANGAAGGADAQDRYKAVPNVSVRTLDAAEDVVSTMASWLAAR